jgi:hypothetical protein
MSLSVLGWTFVAATLLGNAVLLAVLIIRHRWREFFVFTMLTGFETLLIPSLSGVLQFGSQGLYEQLYWPSELIEFLLQLGVVGEIARIVMRPTGTWLHDARKQFILGSAAGVCLAAARAWMLSPPAPNLREGLENGSSFFTSLVVCELFVVMLLTAKRLGLGLRNHVFALVTGWSGWVMVAMVVDLLHGYYGTHFYYDVLENMRKAAYLAALLYWTVQFWLEEPARKELPAELSAYIQALHERMKKDIDKLDTQR